MEPAPSVIVSPRGQVRNIYSNGKSNDSIKNGGCRRDFRERVAAFFRLVCPSGCLASGWRRAGYAGAAMNKGLTIRTGQTHVNRYALDLLRRIEEGQIDPSYIITHRARLQDGPGLYETFRDKKDGCIKVVLTP